MELVLVHLNTLLPNWTKISMKNEIRFFKMTFDIHLLILNVIHGVLIELHNSNYQF